MCVIDSVCKHTLDIWIFNHTTPPAHTKNADYSANRTEFPHSSNVTLLIMNHYSHAQSHSIPDIITTLTLHGRVSYTRCTSKSIPTLLLAYQMQKCYAHKLVFKYLMETVVQYVFHAARAWRPPNLPSASRSTQSLI